MDVKNRVTRVLSNKFSVLKSYTIHLKMHQSIFYIDNRKNDYVVWKVSLVVTNPQRVITRFSFMKHLAFSSLAFSLLAPCFHFMARNFTVLVQPFPDATGSCFQQRGCDKPTVHHPPSTKQKTEKLVNIVEQLKRQIFPSGDSGD